MTEQEKMLLGKIYDPSDEILSTLRGKAHKLSQQYNNTLENETAVRKQILEELIPKLGKSVFLQGPIQFDYGVFTSMGNNCYANFNFTV